MASIQKRSASWRAVIRRKNHPAQIKTFPTKAAAEAWARSIESAMDQATFVDVRSYRTTGVQLLQRYMDEVSTGKKGCKWEQVRLRKLMRAKFLAKPINDVQKLDVIRWKKEQSVSAPSLRREMILLSSVFNHAKKEWGLPVVNPLHGVSLPADSKPRNRRPSIEELGAIRAHFSEKKMGLLVELAIETAMRLGELCSLDWKDVHLEARYVFLSDTKNGTERRVPLSTRAIALLDPFRGVGPLFSFSAVSAGVYWREAMKQLGIKNLHFHDLRHEATTRLAEKLINVLELAAVTGHKDLKMLQRYYNPSMMDLATKLG